MKKEPLKIKADDLKLNFHVDLHDAKTNKRHALIGACLLEK